MTENVRKFEKALREDEELRARFAAEFKRIAEEKRAGNDAEAYIKAAKALGVDLSLAEVEKASAENRELSPDEMAAVAGGEDRDWLRDGCAATVEAGSDCYGTDMCGLWPVIYEHRPTRHKCSVCGICPVQPLGICLFIWIAIIVVIIIIVIVVVVVVKKKKNKENENHKS